MKRIIVVTAILTLAAAFLSARTVFLATDGNIAAVSAQRGTYTVKSAGEYANIFDCELEPLVNCSEKYEAVIIPNHISSVRLQPYIVDTERYLRDIEGNLPFLCEVTEDAAKFDGNIIFRSRVRYDKERLAVHVIGYTSGGEGVSGIEKAFDDLIRSNHTENSVTVHTDALGDVLNGLEKHTEQSGTLNCGVVTTLDKNIQRICENAADECGLKKGAVIVMDTGTGEIKAVVSRPDFDPSDIAASLDDPDAPLVNRALCAYSVGSIFKLVTAASAIEQGISPEYCYTCSGSINVNGQVFNCHKWGGHGEIDMQNAVVNSCNPYFISLSEYLDREKYVSAAKALGFGQESVLCDGMVSAAGTLQTPDDIAVPAERANMSFGQGKLTATPLQICRMTAAIANNGVMNEPTLIKGIRDNDGNIEYMPITAGKRVISYETAKKLCCFMYNTVRAENSRSKPQKTIAAGKTSTAQTGRYDSYGNEEVNCWFTGYFPYYFPKYAVTILSEGGVSGNVTCGPVFGRIADDITEYERNGKGD